MYSLSHTSLQMSVKQHLAGICYERHRFGKSAPECDLHDICRRRQSHGRKQMINDWQEPGLFITDAQETAF